MAKAEKAQGKRVKYRLEGEVELTALQPLEAVLTSLRDLTSAAQQVGEARLSMSVPRLTNVKL